MGFEEVVYLKFPFEKSGGNVVLKGLKKGFHKLGCSFEVVTVDVNWRASGFLPFTYVRDIVLSSLSDEAKKYLKGFDRKRTLMISHILTSLLPTCGGFTTVIWSHLGYFYVLDRKGEYYNFSVRSPIEKDAWACYYLAFLVSQLNKVYHQVYFLTQAKALVNAGWRQDRILKVSGFVWDDEDNPFPKKVADLDEREYDILIVTSPYKYPVARLAKLIDTQLKDFKICLRVYGYTKLSKTNVLRLFSKLKNVELILDPLPYEEYVNNLLNNSKVFLFASTEETYGVRLFEAAAYMPVVSLTHYSDYDFDIKVSLERVGAEILKLIEDKDKWTFCLEKSREASKRENFDTLLNDLNNLIRVLQIQRGGTKRNVRLRQSTLI